MHIPITTAPMPLNLISPTWLHAQTLLAFFMLPSRTRTLPQPFFAHRWPWENDWETLLK